MSHIGEIIQGNFLLSNALLPKNQSLPEVVTSEKNTANQLLQRRNLSQNLRSAKNNNKSQESSAETANSFKDEKNISIPPADKHSAEKNPNQLTTEYQQLSIEIKKLTLVAQQPETKNTILSDAADIDKYKSGDKDINISSHPSRTAFKHGEIEPPARHFNIPTPYQTVKPLQETGQHIDIWA